MFCIRLSKFVVSSTRSELNAEIRLRRGLITLEFNKSQNKPSNFYTDGTLRNILCVSIFGSFNDVLFVETVVFSSFYCVLFP